jgi:dTDP-glucose 4,6-dehydratase
MGKTILITGGAGFIGSHVVRRFVTHHPQYHIINLDALTYAGNLENLKDIEGCSNYQFVKGDINDLTFLNHFFNQHHIDGIIHLAAESHVDRSIFGPLSFINTNVIGTTNLLEAARAHWKNDIEGKRFYHISTDEVYGSLGDQGYFREDSPYNPRSPYSASKASADHLVRSYGYTFGFPVVISNCSNNFGPNQFPEKFIPLIINNIQNNIPIPVYGKGENVRDWLYVEDHAKAIDIVYHNGNVLNTYNIGGDNEWKNLDLVTLICKKMDAKTGKKPGTSLQLVTYVTDRAGHDFRYAVDSSKIQKELGFIPETPFEKGIEMTIDWYLEHKQWMENVLNKEYEKYYIRQYLQRG